MESSIFAEVVAYQFINLNIGSSILLDRASDISQDFPGKIRGKIGRFCGIFTGEKSKFLEKSANFVGF